MATKQISISEIRLDGGTQMRVELSEPAVAEYAEQMEAGVEFDPVRLVHDGSAYWLYDGFHRVHAALRLGHEKIKASYQTGTKRDAVRLAIGANAGLARTNADKRKAIETLLDDPEWGDLSDRQMAKFARVSHMSVNRVRKEREQPPVVEQAATTSAPATEPAPFEPDGAPALAPSEVMPEAPAGESQAMIEGQQHIDAMIEVLDGLRRTVKQSVTLPGCQRLGVDAIGDGIKRTRDLLTNARPDALCPKCDGDNGDCQLCQGLGWIPRSLRSVAQDVKRGEAMRG